MPILKRDKFEQQLFILYEQQAAAGKLDPALTGDGTPEALFWKLPNGAYGVAQFNSAWWGWQAGRLARHLELQPDFDAVRGKVIHQIREDQQDDHYELWLRTNFNDPAIKFLLGRLDAARAVI